MDDTGTTVILNAFCPHHGAHLGYESKVEAGCVRCPFHHFYFDAEGKCRAKDPEKKGHPIKHISTTPRQHRLVDGLVEVLV